MGARATLVATLEQPPSPGGREVTVLPKTVSWLEVRADRTGDIDPDWLRDRFSGRLLYTLRSEPEGGGFSGGPAERRRRLESAARGYDLVDLEAERDLTPELLTAVPTARRVLSWHGAASGEAELALRLRRLSRVPARLYRLAAAAANTSEALVPLRLLRAVDRPDLVAFASGPAGAWTRLLSPRLGAPFVFGRTSPVAAAKGEGGWTLAQLTDDYGLPELPPVAQLFGIVGRTLTRTLSPRLHNAAYRALGLPALYLPFHADGFADFWPAAERELDLLGAPLHGLTVTAPHKEAALAAAERASPLAQRAGAANTLLRRGDGWRADTADAIGVLAVLAARGIEVQGKRAAVVGCGGAGRAAAAGLERAGAQVTLVNRGRERGEYAACLLGLPFVALGDFDPRGFSLLVNATPCLDTEPAFRVDHLEGGTTVVDMPYGTAPTPLVTAAAARGCIAVDGRAVLEVEARHQFELMTGRAMPGGLVRAVLGPFAAPRRAAAWPAERRPAGAPSLPDDLLVEPPYAATERRLP